MLPLEKVRVIDFSQRLPGPYCSSILADLGAEVFMVERAGSPPETRTLFPGLFELVNRNKKSLTLDLKTEEGKKIAGELIRRSDILVEEFRPGVADRLGIGYDHARKANPAIIYCSISGFGHKGPYRDRVGHDINYLSLSGILSISGQPEIPPSRPGVPIVDLASGMYGAIAILAALRKREREGTGEYIDLSMLDAMICWMSTRAGSLLVYGKNPQDEHLSALNNVFETKDGRKISLGVVEENFWQNFVEAIGRRDLAEDPRFSSPTGRRRNMRALMGIVKKIMAGRTLEEWEKSLDWRNVPYAPVYSIGEAMNDAHVKNRGLLQEIETQGIGKIREVLFPVQFSGFPMDIRRPPPQWGEHTNEILKDLGYSEGEIDYLRKDQIV